MKNKQISTYLISFLTPLNLKNQQRTVLIWVFWTIIFSLAYTQSPLFTSNQNQYFLHGFAEAGIGNLQEDWLANTFDPTPVFSKLTYITARYLTPGLFYIYYALLMGLYLFFLVRIIRLSRPIEISSKQDFFLISLIIVLHSAGFRYTLSRTLGANWSYLFEDGLAGQRLLGPVFQPSTFGILFLISIFLFLRSHLFWASILAILAATIHPTYLLAAAILIFSYLIIYLWEAWISNDKYIFQKTFLSAAYTGIITIFLISPTLYYLFRFFGSPSDVSAYQARDILIHFRIPHHALIENWFDTVAVAKLTIFFVALLLARKTKLSQLMAITGLIAAGITILQLITKNNFLALVFPWRISVILIPISTFLVVDRFLTLVLHTNFMQKPSSNVIFRTLISAFLIIAFFTGITRQVLDENRKDNTPEENLFRQLVYDTGRDRTFLVPIKLQDFRLETGLAIFVDFKSIPYRDSDVLEWYRRIQLADEFYEEPSCEKLRTIFSQENLTDALVPRRLNLQQCESFSKTYSDENYVIFTYNQKQ